MSIHYSTLFVYKHQKTQSSAIIQRLRKKICFQNTPAKCMFHVHSLGKYIHLIEVWVHTTIQLYDVYCQFCINEQFIGNLGGLNHE